MSGGNYSMSAPTCWGAVGKTLPSDVEDPFQMDAEYHKIHGYYFVLVCYFCCLSQSEICRSPKQMAWQMSSLYTKTQVLHCIRSSAQLHYAVPGLLVLYVSCIHIYILFSQAEHGKIRSGCVGSCSLLSHHSVAWSAFVLCTLHRCPAISLAFSKWHLDSSCLEAKPASF